MRKTLIQSVERALNILEAVRDNEGPIRAIDIARAVGLSSAASNNIVRTLFIRGYLDQDGNGRYVLGGQSFLLGAAGDPWAELKSAAREPMRSLGETTGDMCFLGVAYHGQVIGVNVVEGSGPVAVPPRQNWLEQFHSTAVGKVLMAAMTPEMYAEVKEDYELRQFTEQTIRSWNELEQELVEVRKQGFAVSHDESVFGITSIAVPVYDSQGEIIAGLSVVFSSYFLTDEYREKALSRLRNASEEITKRYRNNG